MKLIEKLQQNNLALMRRVETASGYRPLAELDEASVQLIMQEAARARQWQDVPPEHRALVEKAEAARERNNLCPLPFLSKT